MKKYITVLGVCLIGVSLHSYVAAAAHQQSEMQTIKILLRARANTNIKDSLGKTPLMYAVQNNMVPLACLLLEAGAAIDDVEIQGNTALVEAVRCGNCAMVKMLILAGADSEKKNLVGSTAWTIPLRAQARGSTREKMTGIMQDALAERALLLQMQDARNAINREKSDNSEESKDYGL